MFPHVGLSNLIMVYLLGVVVVATRAGRGPTALASVLSVAVFDFFFVPPYLSFAVSDTEHLITFTVMLIVALVISGLTVRIRAQADRARDRERRIAALYALSRDLATTRDVDGLLDTAVRHIADVFPGQLAVLLPGDDGRVAPRRMHPAEFSMDASELAVAHWVYEHRQLAGLGTATLPGARALYLPLVGSRGAVGVLGMSPADAHALESPEQLHQLETFANQMALAIERAQASEDARRAEVRAEAERLRNSLLSSVSHDLRTPLASITGAASSLLEAGDELGDATRKELLSSIHQEAERLDRLVNNLLEMTRLEAGGVTIRREWQPLEGVLGAALKRLEGRLRDREVHIDLPGDLPLVPLDALLVEQVLINILENAAKYTPAGSRDRHLGGERRRSGADRHRGPRPGLRDRRGRARVRQVLPEPGREGPRRRAGPRDLPRHHRRPRRKDLGRAAGRRRRRLPLHAADRRRSARGTSRRWMKRRARRPPPASRMPPPSARSPSSSSSRTSRRSGASCAPRSRVTAIDCSRRRRARTDSARPSRDSPTSSSWTSACPTSTGSR